MTIEIQKPELEALILERMQKGAFASIEDALMQALESSPLPSEPSDTLYVSVVNIAEIRFGIELQRDVVRRGQLNDGLTLKLRPAFAGRTLPVTEDILVKWRVLMENGRKMGHIYSHPDLLPAATALQHGLTVVTRDRSDFDMARVPVFNPWKPIRDANNVQCLASH
jgi:predicted nucleic acid-binding protein